MVARATQTLCAWSWSVVLGATVTLLGCDDGPLAIQYETEHLRIGTNTFMCQGDLVELENHIAFVEDDLGLEMDRVVDVYVWDLETWIEGDNECGGSLWTWGCYLYKDRVVYSNQFALKHELVHAVVNNPALGEFFNEGIAEGYAAGLARFGYSTPSANTRLTEVDRRTATHFVRWLRTKWGGRLLGELARQDETKFEAIYGFSLVEAEAMYFADTSTIYPPFRDCYGPEFSTDSSAGWRTDVQTDCTSEDTRKGDRSLYATRTLAIPTDGRYSLATDASRVVVYRCEDAPGTIADQLEVSDVPSIYQTIFQTPRRHFEGVEVHTVKLRRGRYNVDVYTDGYEPGLATVRVWPAVGPGPIGG